jgi:large repetitive protein
MGRQGVGRRTGRIAAIGTAVGLVGATLVVVGGTQLAAAAAGCANTAPAIAAVLTCATAGDEDITVPAGATVVTLTVVGAGGGTGSWPTGTAGTGGSGASVTGTVTLPAGTSTVHVRVGAGGAAGAELGGGTGGGGSAVTTASAKLAVAGGGGGGGGTTIAGLSTVGNGGDAGAPGGISGQAPATANGGGAAQPDGTGGAAGGNGDSEPVSAQPGESAADVPGVAQGGTGQVLPSGAQTYGGSGGGGYGGGGGGGGTYPENGTASSAGGGGGSSHLDPSATGAATTLANNGRTTAATTGADGSVTLQFFGPPGAPANAVWGPDDRSATVVFDAPTVVGSATIDHFEWRDQRTDGPWRTLGAVQVGQRYLATVHGLTNGTSYTLQLRAVNSAGIAGPGDAGTVVTPATVPGRPTALTATPSTGGATLTWTAPADNGGAAITSYEYTPNYGIDWHDFATAPTATSGTVTGLTAGQEYVFEVRARNSAGASTPSEDSDAITAGTPSPPTALTATPGDTTALLTFSAPADTGGSAITGWSYSVDGSDWSPFSVGESAPYSYTVAGLTNRTPVTIRVRASNANGDGAPASVTVTPAAAPGAPTGLTATAGNAQATLTFTAPADDGGAPVDHYQYLATPGGSWTDTADAGTTAVVGGLTNGTSYTFGVRAVNAVGAGAASDSSGPVTPQAAPRIDSVSPAVGRTSGGTLLTVDGGGLTGTSAVTVGTSACTGVTVVDDSRVTCTTAAGAAGTVAVAVTTPVGSTSAPAAFRYVAPPTVGTVSPGSGPVGGGTQVVVTGTALTGATAVTVGGAPCTGLTVTGDGSLTCTTPAGSGSSAVAVTTPGGTGSAPAAFTYVPAPQVEAVSPATGSSNGGDRITVTGTHLAGTAAIAVGATDCTSITVVDDSTVRCTTGAAPAGPADVTVTTPYGRTTSSGPLFTVLAAPTLTSVAPDSGSMFGGTAITLHGSGFTGATAVTVGGAACVGVGVVDDTEIRCSTPAGSAGPAAVTVTAPAGTVTQNAFTFVATPRIDAVSPASGPATGGTALRITGLNLGSTSSVTLDGTACGAVDVISASEVGCTTPGHAVGAVNLVLTTPQGSASTTFTYTAGVPSAPTDLTGQPGDGSAQLTFGAPVTDGGSPVTGYQYSRDGGPWTDVTPVGTAPLTVTVTGLANGTPVAFAVRAVTAIGAGAASGTVTVTPRTVPSAPQALTATAQDGGAQLSFRVPASTGGAPVTGYEWSTGGTWQDLATTGTDPLAATVSGLADGLTYAVQVRARNAAGAGPAATVSVTPAGPPGAPGTPVASGSGRTVLLTFTAPASDGGSPVLRYEYSRDDTWIYFPTTAAAGTVTGSLYGLTPGRQYGISVRAVSAQGAGAASAETTVTP